MKRTHIKIAIALALSPLAGFSQSSDFVVQGKVKQEYNGRFIKLFYESDAAKRADSALIKEGKFELKGQLSAPTVGILSLGGKENGDRIDIFLSEGTLKISAKDSIHYARVTGTKAAKTHDRLVKKMQRMDDKFMNGFSTYANMAEGAEKKAFLDKLMEGFDEYNTFKRETIHAFVEENPDSYVSLYYLNKSAPKSMANYETSYPYFSLLTERLRTTPLGKQLESRLLATKGNLTGKPYKDFVSTTLEGTQLSLKEVIAANKYTLVDFWASWCGPCRKENPNVVKTFNDFKDKGFTVLSVSLDTDAGKWKEAIAKDGMPWHHVSSLKGWREPAAALYGVRAIPQNVLIDQKGRIVASNLRAEALYNKVSDLIN